MSVLLLLLEADETEVHIHVLEGCQNWGPESTILHTKSKVGMDVGLLLVNCDFAGQASGSVKLYLC